MSGYGLTIPNPTYSHPDNKTSPLKSYFCSLKCSRQVGFAEELRLTISIRQVLAVDAKPHKMSVFVSRFANRQKFYEVYIYKCMVMIGGVIF